MSLQSSNSPPNVNLGECRPRIRVHELFEDEAVEGVTVAVKVTAADGREHLAAGDVGERQVILVLEI